MPILVAQPVLQQQTRHLALEHWPQALGQHRPVVRVQEFGKQIAVELLLAWQKAQHGPRALVHLHLAGDPIPGPQRQAATVKRQGHLLMTLRQLLVLLLDKGAVPRKNCSKTQQQQATQGRQQPVQPVRPQAHFLVLLFAQSHRHIKRETWHLPEVVPARHAIHGHVRIKKTFRRRLRQNLLCRPCWQLVALRPDPAVTPQQHRIALLPQVQTGVKTGKITGIQRHHHHAGKTAVRLADASGEMDRPFVGDPPQHRLRNKQFIAGARHMHLEVLPVSQVDRRCLGQVAQAEHALGIDDAHVVQ